MCKTLGLICSNIQRERGKERGGGSKALSWLAFSVAVIKTITPKAIWRKGCILFTSHSLLLTSPLELPSSDLTSVHQVPAPPLALPSSDSASQKAHQGSAPPLELLKTAYRLFKPWWPDLPCVLSSAFPRLIQGVASLCSVY